MSWTDTEPTLYYAAEGLSNEKNLTMCTFIVQLCIHKETIIVI